MPFELRTIAATLMALAALFVVTSSLPGKAIEPSGSPAVHVTVATQRLSIPALISNGRRFTRTVLRL